jgi:hypothetical protein
VGTITITIPEALAGLPESERDFLIRAGVREAVAARLRQLEVEYAEALQHIRGFEQQYGMPLKQFESDLLPELDSPGDHDLYNDWFYWQSVADEIDGLLSQLRQPPT